MLASNTRTLVLALAASLRGIAAAAPKKARRRRLLSTSAAATKTHLFEADACKTVFFVRHAEGWHNKDAAEVPSYFDGLHLSPKYRDARLTPLGERQSETLRQKLVREDVSVDLVVVSSLSRAIQTAELSFGKLEKRPPFISTELCRERIAEYTCDHRRTREDLELDFPYVDFSHVEYGPDIQWETKEDDASAAARGLAFLDWLAARPEKRIAVTSHWVFLQNLFRVALPASSSSSASAASPDTLKMGNAEMRRMVVCGCGDDAGSRIDLYE